MKFSIKDIAEILNGKIEGNPKAEVSELSKIEEGKKGSLSFLSNVKYSQYLYTTMATAVIIDNSFELEKPVDTILIRVEDSYKAFATLLEYYNNATKIVKVGVSKMSHISESAVVGKELYLGEFSSIGDNVVLGDNVKIYPNCYIGDDSVIGDNVVLYSGVKIYHNIKIGDNCIVHSNTVIGSDGFGFAPSNDNDYNKVPQIGNVVIGNKVEIGSACTIDRATLGSTIIESGVKLDNQIQIAHNVVVAKNTVIAAQTGIAGSSKIGSNCMIGGQVGVVGHLNIGNNVKIAAQSGIASDVKKDSIIQGSPSFNVSDYRRSYVYFKRLPNIVKQIRNIEESLKKDN